MFCCVHTADLGAVALSSVIRASASHALDEHDLLRSFSVREALQMSACRSCCVHDTLQLKGCDDIFALAVSILVISVKLDHVESGCDNDRAVLLCDDLIFLIVINRACLADFRTDSALSGLELDTCVAVDDRNVRDCLCERCIDCASCAQAAVELTRSLLAWAFLLA